MEAGATICACATALGGVAALIRVSGPAARAVATAAGLALAAPRCRQAQELGLAWGRLPVVCWWYAGPHSATGHDVVEVLVPGAPDVVALVLEHLCRWGALPAGPGAFTRQALANRRLSLDQAEAVLAVVHAGDASGARLALERLQGQSTGLIREVRKALIALIAQVEAGLDFVDEQDVRSYDPAAMWLECRRLAQRLQPLEVAADAVGMLPQVVLCGPANAGKSALFARLTGSRVLISPQPGTTRDWLEADWLVAGRRVRLVDTAGWLEHPTGLDASGIAAGRARLTAADLVLVCSAPDALAGTLPAGAVCIATKTDLPGPADARAVLGLSCHSGSGLGELEALVAGHLSQRSVGEPRQQRLIQAAIAGLERIVVQQPADECLAEDLRACANHLGDLIGATTPEDVLGWIFSRFCIGK